MTQRHDVNRALSRLLFLILATLSIAAPVSAQISVDNVIVHLAAGQRPVHNVTVGNASDSPAYVTVEVESVPNPATSEATAPTGDLLASPKSFSIEPKGQRTVRLLLKSPPTDTERVFRVAFVPQDRGFGQEIAQEEKGRKTVLRVLTGMGILVFADPMKPKAALEWERHGDLIRFKNTGNVNIYLGDGQSCAAGGACSKVASKRLYAGSEFEVHTPAGNTVTWLKQESGAGDYQKFVLAPGDASGSGTP